MDWSLISILLPAILISPSGEISRNSRSNVSCVLLTILMLYTLETVWSGFSWYSSPGVRMMVVSITGRETRV